MSRSSSIKQGLFALIIALLALCACPPMAHAEIASGTNGGCTWVIDDDGNLVISPTNGTSGALEPYGFRPWGDYANDIKTVYAEPGVSSGRYGIYLFAFFPNLESVDLSNMNLGPLQETAYMFRGCTNLKSVNLGENTLANATDMSGMFADCSSLEELDVSLFNTAKVTDMYGMFHNCSSLTSLDVSNFDTARVTDMSLMFSTCSNLTELNLSNFNTSNVMNIAAMFQNCTSLTNVNVSSFDTSKVTDMRSVFFKCSSLTELDVTNFNTSSTELMRNMFDRTSLTSLDVSSFDTSNVTEMSFMFNIPTLQQLTLGENFAFHVNEYNYPIMPGGRWTTDPNFGEGSVYYEASTLEQVYDGPSMANTYYKVSADYMALELGPDNLWLVSDPANRFKGYCLNLMREGVFGYYDRVLANDEFIESSILDPPETGSTHGSAPIGSTLREALITLIYYGWPNDAAGIQQRFGLTDDEYMDVTQEAIWDFTNRYDNKYGPSSLEGKKLEAYNELVAQKFANIEGTYDLYVYLAESSIRQNLLSIEGLQPEGENRAGLRVHKHDADGDDPLSGAEFTVYRAENEAEAQAGQGVECAVITSDETGRAATGPHDLALGWYVVRETKAPGGYTLDETSYYAVNVSNADIVHEAGDWYAGGEYQKHDTIIFYDTYDDSFQGGGLRILKTNAEGAPIQNAQFEVLQGEEVVATLLTNEEGIAQTGAYDLALGTYTVRESKAPQGYFKLDEQRSVTIANDGDFITEGLEFTDAAKQGKATIQAHKTLKGADLQAGQLTFVLKDVEGNEIERATNDENGDVSFSTITYGPADLGYKNYYIEEIPGDDELVTYDDHSELVTVVIEDDGSDDLQCYVRIDADGPEFTNTYASTEPDATEAEIKVVKHLKDALIHEGEFEFGLYTHDGTLVEAITTTQGKLTGEDEYSSRATVAFKPLTFEKAGTYSYEIREHTKGATEVVEGDANNQAGIKPGFYQGGVLLDTKTQKVQVDVIEEDGKLVASVAYADADDGAHVDNEYNEIFIEVDEKDEHPNDGRHDDETSSSSEEITTSSETSSSASSESSSSSRASSESSSSSSGTPASPTTSEKKKVPAPKIVKRIARSVAQTSDFVPAHTTSLLVLVLLGSCALSVTAARRQRR